MIVISKSQKMQVLRHLTTLYRNMGRSDNPADQNRKRMLRNLCIELARKKDIDHRKIRELL